MLDAQLGIAGVGLSVEEAMLVHPVQAFGEPERRRRHVGGPSKREGHQVPSFGVPSLTLTGLNHVWHPVLPLGRCAGHEEIMGQPFQVYVAVTGDDLVLHMFLFPDSGVQLPSSRRLCPKKPHSRLSP